MNLETRNLLITETWPEGKNWRKPAWVEVIDELTGITVLGITRKQAMYKLRRKLQAMQP